MTSLTLNNHPSCCRETAHRPMLYHEFLSRVSILTRDIDIANLSVCQLSVCPSVRYVPVPYENGLTYCQFFHYTVAQSF